MPLDVISYVESDTIPFPPEKMPILLVHSVGTASEKKTYKSLTEVGRDYANATRTYRQAQAIFAQIYSLSGYMAEEVDIVSIDAPADADAWVAALEAINKEYDGLYWFMVDEETDAILESLGVWAASTKPTLAQMRNGVEDRRMALLGQTSSMALLGKGIARSFFAYVDPGEEAQEVAAGAYGVMVGFYPKHATWKFKQIYGATKTSLTREDRDRLEEGYVNFVTEENKLTYLKNGVLNDGTFVDVMIAEDYITRRIRDYLYNAFIKTANIDYTDEGFTVLGAAVIAGLGDAVTNNMIPRDAKSNMPLYTINIPAAASATEAQRRKREMPSIAWRAQVTGAVHSAESLGVLAVTL